MLETLSCGVAVIGAGAGGLAAYHAAKATNAKVLLIEAEAGGTTCARCGCMPYKLLLAAPDAPVWPPPLRRCGSEPARRSTARDAFVADILKEVAAIPAYD